MKKIIAICIFCFAFTLAAGCCENKTKKKAAVRRDSSPSADSGEISIVVKKEENVSSIKTALNDIDSSFTVNKFYNPYIEKIEERKQREEDERKRLEEIQRLRREEEERKRQEEKNKVVIDRNATLLTTKIETITPEKIISNITDSFKGIIKVGDSCIAIIGEQLIEENNIFEVMDNKNNTHSIIILSITEQEMVVEYRGESYSIKVPAKGEGQ